MYLRQLLRKPRSPIFKSTRARQALRRFQSSIPPPQPSTARTQARANKVLDRVPRFLRRYTDGLRTAPVSHVVAFLILHEITAVVPLIGLASLFHYTNWLPPLSSEYISSGIEKFGRYFRRKQWFGLSEESPMREREMNSDVQEVGAWQFSETGSRVVVEVATAYAITKAILPLRLILSVWMTPWFARIAVGKVGKGLLGLGRATKVGRSSTAGNGAAGTGATAAGTSAANKPTLKK